MTPEDLRYTQEHEWVRVSDDVVRFGITDFAQNSLGDIVFVSLPEPGDDVEAGQPCGEVESTKSVSDVFAPMSGTVVAVNTDLDDDPGRLNADPYGAGWLVDIRVPDTTAELLSAADYDTFTRDL